MEDNDQELSFLIDLKAENTLEIGFNSQINTTGDRLVRDAAVQLDQLTASARLKGKLLKIYGKASLLVSYVIASKILHAYGAIALTLNLIGNIFMPEVLAA